MTDMMNTGRTRAIAWLLLGASLALTGSAIFLLILGWSTPVDPGWGFRGFGIYFALTFSAVGIVVVTNRPANRVGWVFLVIGLHTAFMVFGEEYTHYNILTRATRAQPLPGTLVLAWTVNWAWVPLMGYLAVGLFMLFPDGRFHSRGWRNLAVVAVIVSAAQTVVVALDPGPLQSSAPYLTSPYSIEALDRATERFTFPMMFVLGAAAVALVVRYRSSSREVRQQIKWLVSASVLTALGLTTNVLGLKISEYLTIFAMGTIPAVAGVAILKHRLFDIDLIINRTLVYGALTVTLAAIYFASVVLLQAAFRGVTGQESDLALIVSTLVIAALFQPARRRVQTTIERRLYRSRYDATRTLADFGTRARDEVDVERLSETLVAAVGETIQPAHVSLWLRKGESSP